MKTSKLALMIAKLNEKLEIHSVEGESAVEIRHKEYGHICILDENENLKLAEEIIRDELFEKSEMAQ